MPAKDVVFGCYTSHEGPAIRLSKRGLEVQDMAATPMGFRIQGSKIGYAIETAQPLALADSSQPPRLVIEDRVGGVYLNFYRYDGRRTYGVFELAGPTPFQIVGEISHLNYLPTTAARCRW